MLRCGWHQACIEEQERVLHCAVAAMCAKTNRALMLQPGEEHFITSPTCPHAAFALCASFVIPRCFSRSSRLRR
jgi:nitrite reductase/ring-hydroxylating ferredoxin subunit